MRDWPWYSTNTEVAAGIIRCDAMRFALLKQRVRIQRRVLRAGCIARSAVARVRIQRRDTLLRTCRKCLLSGALPIWVGSFVPIGALFEEFPKQREAQRKIIKEDNAAIYPPIYCL